jgi:CelD/BcsL family acetyltransferase involved in cellulose biosynthesis
MQNGVRIVEFADLNLTDYNAPLLTAAAPRNAARARVLWRDLLSALKRLPGGADLIRLRKMPLDLANGPNPLALLDGARPCPLNGNVVTTGDDFDAYRYSLERTVRKNLERSWRVFTRDPGGGIPDRHRSQRSAARAFDHGDSAGCPNAAPRLEFRPR